jgi:hypothetical protein
VNVRRRDLEKDRFAKFASDRVFVAGAVEVEKGHVAFEDAKATRADVDRNGSRGWPRGKRCVGRADDQFGKGEISH